MSVQSIFEKFILLIILLVLSHSLASQSLNGESFMILAGNKTTDDGSVLVAHNKGFTGDGLSCIKKVRRQKNDSAEMIRLSNGLQISLSEFSMAWMSLQAGEGWKEGEAVAVNEHQVSVGGTVSLKTDRNQNARNADPLADQGVTSQILYITLQKVKSAREYVRIIGRYFNKYGIAWAGGFAVADKNEVWYIETGGGHHWAAIRIPDDAVWIQANGYRIGHINPENNDVMSSPGLLDFARDNGLWNPDEQLFDFADAFGGRTEKLEGKERYNSLRIWRAISLMDSTLRVTPGQKEFPQYIRPKDKIDLEQIISLLRDHYEDTPYFMPGKETSGRKAPPIASSQITHTSIVQLTNGLPADVGAVLWAGFSSPITTPYIPFYFGINNVPKPYGKKVSGEKQASGVYRSLAKIFYKNPLEQKDFFPAVWSDFQKKCIKEQINIDQGSMRLYRMNPDMAREFLTINVHALSQEALDIADKKLKEYQ